MNSFAGRTRTIGLYELAGGDPGFVSWTAEFTMARDDIMHGLAGWFECELAENVWMTNSSLAAQAINALRPFCRSMTRWR